jgi:hypothetical protein
MYLTRLRAYMPGAVAENKYYLEYRNWVIAIGGPGSNLDLVTAFAWVNSTFVGEQRDVQGH